MQLEEIVHALRKAFPTASIEPRRVPLDEAFVALPADCILAAVKLLIERFDIYHLSTITGQDTGREIELLYHFWAGGGLTLRISLPREGARLASVTGLVPGAAFYEREVREMLGVAFDGLADQRPFLLPDDWDGGHPLLAHRPEEVAE